MSIEFKKSAKASAPGRLDVMGGIADYSGSLLLQKTIKARTTVTVNVLEESKLVISTESLYGRKIAEAFSIELEDLFCNNGYICTPEVLRQGLINPATEWAAYALGCVAEGLRQNWLPRVGLDIHISSQVPIGKGVSSSAALEVATLCALLNLTNKVLPNHELPLLAQYIEHNYALAPCGLMDQLSVFYGSDKHLLPLLCQPATVFEPIPIPDELMFIGIDSGVQHAVSGNPYTTARTAAFMGYHVLEKAADALGLDTHWNGYLANVDNALFHTTLERSLPKSLSGEQFLNEYGDTRDTITTPDPETTYPVAACTRHPIDEHNRISYFRDVLKAWEDIIAREAAMIGLGQLMYGSHAGYSACGLGSEATDDLVARCKAAGADRGIYGARVTGGGSGGTVCVLVRKGRGEEVLEKVATAYALDQQVEKMLIY